MREDVDVAVHLASARQQGCFHTADVIAAGSDRQLIRRRVASGRWVQLAPDVFGAPGLPLTWTRRLWVAHLQLGPTSVISHEAGTELNRIEGAARGRVTLIAERRSPHDLPGVTVHRVDDLLESEITRVLGLPVTTPARCLVDLAASVSRARLLHLVQGAVIDRRATLAEIGAILGRVRRKGKPGVLRIEAVLDMLAGEPLDGTHLEILLDQLIASIPGAVPLSETLIAGRTRVVGTVDRLFPAERLIVEADGRKWHSRSQRLANDARRDKEAAALGYQTARFTWEELTHDAVGSRRLLREILAERRRLLSR